MKLIDNYSVALKMMTRSPNGEGNHEIPQSIKEGIKKIFGKYIITMEFYEPSKAMDSSQTQLSRPMTSRHHTYVASLDT